MPSYVTSRAHLTSRVHLTSRACSVLFVCVPRCLAWCLASSQPWIHVKGMGVQTGVVGKVSKEDSRPSVGASVRRMEQPPEAGRDEGIDQVTQLGCSQEQNSLPHRSHPSRSLLQDQLLGWSCLPSAPTHPNCALPHHS